VTAVEAWKTCSWTTLQQQLRLEAVVEHRIAALPMQIVHLTQAVCAKQCACERFTSIHNAVHEQALQSRILGKVLLQVWCSGVGSNVIRKPICRCTGLTFIYCVYGINSGTFMLMH